MTTEISLRPSACLPPTRKPGPRSARTAWLLPICCALGCANVSVGDEDDQEGMGGDGSAVVNGDGDMGTTNSGGSVSVVTNTGGVLLGDGDGDGDTGGDTSSGGMLVGDGDGDTGGTSAGGTSSGGTSAGGTSSGGTSSGGTSSGGTSSGGTSSGGAGTGGAMGSCGSPTVASRSAATCGDTWVWSNALYQCASSNLGNCGTAGVYCQSTDPNHNPYGPVAWTKVMDCP